MSPTGTAPTPEPEAASGSGPRAAADVDDARAAAVAGLRARLAVELDAVAAREAQLAGTAVLVDTRRRASWEHGHIADALHLATLREAAAAGRDGAAAEQDDAGTPQDPAGTPHDAAGTTQDAAAGLPRDRTLVLYGWGPGCNGATRVLVELLEAGLDARELVGGYEYWARNGFPIVVRGTLTRRTPDPLVTAAGEDGPAA